MNSQQIIKYKYYDAESYLLIKEYGFNSLERFLSFEELLLFLKNLYNRRINIFKYIIVKVDVATSPPTMIESFSLTPEQFNKYLLLL